MRAGTWKEVWPPEAWQASAVEASGHTLEFDPVTEAGMPEAERQSRRQRVIIDFSGRLGELLRAKQRTLVIEAAGWWLAPLITLSAPGWGVAWVRRGFVASR